ncbi:MAG: hypothetical protein BZY88_15590 [SAR202 cluster bacterium Io17-Chloro-G9]|nr:MAG: hypothetical protein BZY88_15590 [SAR202 cluster bacterium Io17-Chloro-G9]
MDPAERDRLLNEVLKGVSRSFYLTIRVLPRRLRPPVGLAYLLARAADTIADTRVLAPALRLERLLAFREQVRGPADLVTLQSIFDAASVERATPQERALMESLPQAFALVEALPESDRLELRTVVDTLTLGMELDLTTFPAEDSGGLSALAKPEDLDRYVYLVAGCVGRFWTVVTAAHEPRLASSDVERMSETGVRFGKALQLTNVLRDVPRDLMIGRCYLPGEDLAGSGLTPEDLLDPANAARARAVLVTWTETALGHFECAQDYLLAIPRRCVRLRLAVLWPLLLGLGTLARLVRNEDWLAPGSLSKVSRRWVYWMMVRSIPAALSDTLLRGWIGSLRRQVKAGL